MKTLPLDFQALRTWRIVVKWDVSRSADNKTRRGGHWAQRAKIMRLARETAHFYWAAAGKPIAAGKVRVSLICRRGRTMDSANIVGGAKPILDGIFVKAMTPDDSPKYVELGGVTQETGKRWKGAEELELVIEEMA